MALFYHRKKDTVDKNTADPWNTAYGVDFGQKAKADSQQATYTLKAATEDLPAKPKDDNADNDKAEES